MWPYPLISSQKLLNKILLFKIARISQTSFIFQIQNRSIRAILHSSDVLLTSVFYISQQSFTCYIVQHLTASLLSAGEILFCFRFLNDLSVHV